MFLREFFIRSRPLLSNQNVSGDGRVPFPTSGTSIQSVRPFRDHSGASSVTVPSLTNVLVSFVLQGVVVQTNAGFFFLDHRCYSASQVSFRLLMAV